LPPSPDPKLQEQAERFLAAVRQGRGAAAERMLRAHPRLAGRDVFTAAAAADPRALARLLARDRRRAVAKHGEEEWPPLAYACASRRHRVSERHARALRRVATLLMEAGASPDSHSVYREAGDRKAPISVLYHACMSDHVALVRLLLERGAKTQDGESIYHAAQFNRRACLAALVEYGADLSSRQSPYGNTPLYFLVGHRSDGNGTARWFKGLTWLLEHGADPNVTSYASGEAPLHGVARGDPKPATARRLLEHGADVDLPRADGRTPYALALRHGNRAVAAVLLEHGARREGLEPLDEFLGACLDADPGRARALLAAHPRLLEALGEKDRGALIDAVRQDRAAAVRLMVDLGFQVGWPDAEGATPLHVAAWEGKASLVRLLLSLGAPVNVRDGRFGCSPLAWAAHGSRFGDGEPATYAVIVNALLDAGSDRATAINGWGEPPEAIGSAAIARLLRTRGFAPR